MSNFDETAGYFEDDEPVDVILAAFEQGLQGVTGPPSGAQAGQQVLPSDNFRTVMPGLCPAGLVGDKARRGELVQA